ncbi:nucleotidyltransferase domain-containing protein, partial [bacterium]|nr:nucleotidyltransferase domain-containing protein [bacterium]
MNKKSLSKIDRILIDVKKCLENIYGSKLKDIILIGSYARGDFTDDSDIDIILLLDDMKDPISEMENYFDAFRELDLKYDTLIS